MHIILQYKQLLLLSQGCYIMGGEVVCEIIALQAKFNGAECLDAMEVSVCIRNHKHTGESLLAL